MIMWAIILVVAIIGIIAAIWYVINRITKFRFIDIIEDKTIYKDKPRTANRARDFGLSAKYKYMDENPDSTVKYKTKRSWLRTLIATIIFLVTFGILFLCFNGVEAVVILFHLAVIWLIVEAIFTLLYKFHLDLTQLKVYLAGILAIVFTVICMVVANYLGTNVFVTNYTIDTNKNVEPIRIVQIADTHLGITLNKDNFKDLVDKINAQNPDIVVLTGDFVDDSSTYEDMVGACEALSKVNSKYGVYFSYGNHDRGYYKNEDRGYDGAILEETLKANNVKILEDQIDVLDDQYMIIGRADKSRADRMSISQLVGTVDKYEFNKDYSIVLDHQPNDYENESNAFVDLVLSGHTHGGQCLPINRIGELIGANDATYGHHKINDTDFIVTSGASSWGLRFKTGTCSELVVIDVK
ncbi:MAG: metallophosphoesterase [Lachnospiraceae bacterium]|nr:metallophosphoesterase [Lachnospiraceae bacterium]